MHKLQRYLKDNGISQKWFATQIGIGEHALSLIIQGRTNPRISTAMKIEKASKGAVTIYDLAPQDPEVEKETKPAKRKRKDNLATE